MYFQLLTLREQCDFELNFKRLNVSLVKVSYKLIDSLKLAYT
jgi:hypothetical protein